MIHSVTVPRGLSDVQNLVETHGACKVSQLSWRGNQMRTMMSRNELSSSFNETAHLPLTGANIL